jgi:hypothetical protein
LPPGMALGRVLTSVRGDRGENYEKWTAGSPKTYKEKKYFITSIFWVRVIGMKLFNGVYKWGYVSAWFIIIIVRDISGLICLHLVWNDKFYFVFIHNHTVGSKLPSNFLKFSLNMGYEVVKINVTGNASCVISKH